MKQKMKVRVPSNFAGWISKEYLIGWVINPYRRDKRTGVIRRAK